MTKTIQNLDLEFIERDHTSKINTIDRRWTTDNKLATDHIEVVTRVTIIINIISQRLG
mgnify:CR=1 FL=1|jgi:hypothetical protein